MSKNKPEYFGTDGIRGVVGQFPLVPEFVLKLGYASGLVLKGSSSHPTVIVGRDTRQSGQMLQNALVAGLLSAEATIIDVGVIPTPGVSYLVRKLGADAGVIISASHNPVEQNGIKFVKADGSKLSESTELEIENLALDESFWKNAPGNRFGRAIDGNGMRELYVDGLLLEHPNLDLSKFKIVLDCANGAASWYAPECLSRLGAQIVAINASPTGSNINQQAGSEQIRKHPEELLKLVQQYSANFGIAFDGDADRVVFVDEKGILVDGDFILAVLADYLAKRGNLLANSIVATSMRNQGLVNFANDNGFTFIETKVGDKFVTEQLMLLDSHGDKSTRIGLGGEQAGHIILYDREHNTGDGIRTALFVLKALIEENAPSLSSLAGRIIKTPQVIASAYVPSKPDLNQVEELEQIKLEVTQKVSDIKRMELRYSGTEPLFRVMLEAGITQSEQDLANYAWKMCRAVQKATGQENYEGYSIEILNVSKGGVLHPQVIGK
jgi:phosphoglucosamine mutase